MTSFSTLTVLPFAAQPCSTASPLWSRQRDRGVVVLRGLRPGVFDAGTTMAAFLGCTGHSSGVWCLEQPKWPPKVSLNGHWAALPVFHRLRTTRSSSREVMSLADAARVGFARLSLSEVATSRAAAVTARASGSPGGPFGSVITAAFVIGGFSLSGRGSGRMWDPGPPWSGRCQPMRIPRGEPHRAGVPRP